MTARDLFPALLMSDPQSISPDEIDLSVLSLVVSGSGMVRSADFETGVDGWAIFGDGSAEFNDILVRGDIEAGVWDGASPANLATVIDPNATSGFYLDSSAGVAQFATGLYVGNLVDKGYLEILPGLFAGEISVQWFDANDDEIGRIEANTTDFVIEATGTLLLGSSGLGGTAGVTDVLLYANDGKIELRAEDTGTPAAAFVDVWVNNANVGRFTDDGLTTSARWVRTSDMAIAHNTSTTLQGAAGVDLTVDHLNDPNGIFDIAGGVVTVATAGIYEITAGVAWANNATGFRRIGIEINGSLRAGQSSNTVNATWRQMVSTGPIELAANDTFEASVLQTSGGDLNLLGSEVSFLSVVKVP